MSYHHRKRQRAIHLAQQHEFYEAPSGNELAMSNEIGEYPAMFTGPRETVFSDADNYVMTNSGVIDSIRDDVQWDVGGIQGQTKNVGSTGVTDPQTVDAHSFTGEMAVIRRMPDTNYGPVKTADSNSLLSLLYQMTESNHYFPNEVSQADIIKAV